MSEICAQNGSKCNKDTAPTFSFRNAHFYPKNIQNCHSNSFELNCMQSSILCALRLFSVLVRNVQFSLKHYCISECHSQEQKNICKNTSICLKDTAPTFLLVESKNPPDTAHTNSLLEQLPVTKKLSAVFGNLMGKEELYE